MIPSTRTLLAGMAEEIDRIRGGRSDAAQILAERRREAARLARALEREIADRKQALTALEAVRDGR